MPKKKSNMNYIRDSPSNQIIQTGDVCLIYVSEHLRYPLKIEAGIEIQTKFGHIKADDLVGHHYGKRYDCKKGWVLPLRLTPELWTQSLPHRTQILYQADISMILLQLDIKPGSVVVECGTGSGSLSHAIIRACLPNGYLHTFDNNANRVQCATTEFKEHGFGDNVTIYHRDVCTDGFDPKLVEIADACMLDLPQTSVAIEHAYKVMKKTESRLCTFSPCIEQVKMNVTEMLKHGFKEIATMECLLRPLEVKTQSLRLWDDEILKGLVDIDEKRLNNLKERIHVSKKMKTDLDENEKNINGDKVIDGQLSTTDSMREQYSEKLIQALNDPKVQFHPNMLPKQSQFHARSFNESINHSGFLTFATKRT